MFIISGKNTSFPASSEIKIDDLVPLRKDISNKKGMIFLGSNRHLPIRATRLDLFPSLTFLGPHVGHLAELAYTKLHRLSWVCLKNDKAESFRRGLTPPKTNMEPEHDLFQKGNHLPNLLFMGFIRVFLNNPHMGVNPKIVVLPNHPICS